MRPTYQLPRLASLPALLAMAFAQAQPAPNTLPIGGQVVAGQAQIKQGSAQMTVTQTSPRAAIDWQSFNLGSQAQISFQQPDAGSVTLNRVLGGDASQIFGRISSNGQVFLSNPAGIYFSPTARADVGALVATTHGISNADFMAGRRLFERQGATGSIVNEGQLNADLGGYIALLAPQVRNSGLLLARAGTVALAAGEAVELQFQGGSLARLRVTPSQIAALVDNHQAVLAPDGLILMSAQAAQTLQGGVIRHSGSLVADSLTAKGGRIVLEAGDITLAAGSSISANGASGGGSVHVGGERQGGGEMLQARRVSMEAGARIEASATQRGDGGEIVLWSDVHQRGSRTTALGSLQARGGAQGGDGGFIETSGAQLEIGASTSVSTTAAPGGKSGLWLLDPYNYTIGASEAAVIASALGSSDVTVSTAVDATTQGSSGNVADAGDITVNAALSWSANTLTLSAHRSIRINALLDGGAAGKLALYTGQGAVAAGNSAGHSFSAAGRVDLAAGPNFSTRLGSDGVVKAYTVITALGAQGSSNFTDLQGMQGSLSSNYALGANIDASSTASWSTGAGFAPVGNISSSFTGSFDGLGHTISGLTLTRPSSGYIGLFGTTGPGASISNVGLLGGSATGANVVGMLAGRNLGKISNSYATGNVAGTGTVGGLAGQNFSGTISNSYATGSVTSSNINAGGLVGSNSGAGDISNSYATGSVAGIRNVGGLVGSNNSFVGISNSYAAGSVTGALSTGGLVGLVISGSFSNSYWDIASTGQASSAGGTGISAEQSTSQAAYSGFDFANTWTLFAGQSRPLLRAFMTPLTVTVNNAVKTYDGLAYAGTPDLSYSVTPNGNLLGSVSWTNAKNVGSYAAGGLYSSQQGYLISYVGGLTINKATISAITGITADNKTYDGSTATSLTLTGAAFTGKVANEQLSVTSASGQFADKNAGSGKTVLISGITLGGADAGNYELASSTSSTTADIARASIGAVTGITATNKTYDGSQAASLNSTGAVFTGRIANDQLSVAAANGEFADKNAGSGKTVNISGITLGGADAGNYELASSTSSTTADIAKASINAVNGITVANRAYDGTTRATLNTIGAMFSGMAANDQLSVATASGQFADKNAGSGKTVNISGITLGGADAGNYELATSTASATADIAKASIGAVTGITAANKTYDGSQAASLNSTGAAFTGRIANDQLSVAAASGQFADKNAGSGKTVLISGITLGGADAGNYQLSSSMPSTTADIAKASIGAVTGITAANRVYDGTTRATLNTLGAMFTGMATNDQLSVATASGQFADKNAGSGKTVSISGITLGGADAGNYELASSTASTTADIAKASINAVNGITVANRVYDGTTRATLNTVGAMFSGMATNDQLSVATASGEFADKHAGSGKTVHISGLTLGGADAGNYQLSSSTSSTTADIAKASIGAVTGITAANKVYDGTTAVSLDLSQASLSGRIGQDELLISGASAAFADKQAGRDKPVLLAALSLGGADAGNYRLLSSTASAVADISPASISAITGIAAANRVYDGGTSASLNLAAAGFAGLIEGDVLTVASASAAFADKQAGGGKTVTISGLSLGGADAGNYRLASSTASTTADITRAPINAVSGITAANKLEDGNTAATLQLELARFEGRIANDALSVAQALGSFDNAQPGVGKPVSITGLVLGGADAGNYQLLQTQASTRANISAKPVPPAQPETRPPGAAAPLLTGTGQPAPGLLLDAGTAPASAATAFAPVGPVPAQATAAAAAAAPSAIIVALLPAAQPGANDQVSVSVPRERAGGGGFSFALPAALQQAVEASGQPPTASAADGSPLPTWLRFVPETGSFIASAVPEGALPFEALLRIGGQSAVIKVSERAD